MKIIMVMLQSINGKISKGQEDNLMWGGKEDKKHFKEITKKIGTIIYGSSTFDATGKRVLPGRRNIVLTRNAEKYSDIEKPAADSGSILEFSSESPEELIGRLEKEGLEEVAVIGGSKINTLFFNAGLIDEIYLTIAPTIFNGTVPLVTETLTNDVNLQLESMEKIDENGLLLHYLVKKN